MCAKKLVGLRGSETFNLCVRPESHDSDAIAPNEREIIIMAKKGNAVKVAEVEVPTIDPKIQEAFEALEEKVLNLVPFRAYADSEDLISSLSAYVTFFPERVINAIQAINAKKDEYTSSVQFTKGIWSDFAKLRKSAIKEFVDLLSPLGIEFESLLEDEEKKAIVLALAEILLKETASGGEAFSTSLDKELRIPVGILHELIITLGVHSKLVKIER